jgi:thiol-disulfide isomerase/thioredoxin
VTGSTWVASYVILWVTVILLCFTVVVLLRQIGVLHARLRPLGVHHGGEGLDQDSPAPPVPGVDYAASGLTLVTFTSPTCEVCRELVPSIGALERTYSDVNVVLVSHGPDSAPTFRAFNVSSTPYVVAVDRNGSVRGGGVANSLEQIEVLIEGALHA